MWLENLRPILLKVNNMQTSGSSVDVVNFLKKLEVCVSYHLQLILLMYFPVSEIKSLTTGIEQATSRGTLLVRFFNSADDASSLKSHNNNLDQLITEATVSQLIGQFLLSTKSLLYKACCCYEYP